MIGQPVVALGEKTRNELVGVFSPRNMLMKQKVKIISAIQSGLPARIPALTERPTMNQRIAMASFECPRVQDIE